MSFPRSFHVVSMYCAYIFRTFSTLDPEHNAQHNMPRTSGPHHNAQCTTDLTLQKPLAYCRAISAPTPLEAPVITATRLLRLIVQVCKL